jgi:hypothetical protein
MLLLSNSKKKQKPCKHFIRAFDLNYFSDETNGPVSRHASTLGQMETPKGNTTSET